jgi:hypothetical protein
MLYADAAGVASSEVQQGSIRFLLRAQNASLETLLMGWVRMVYSEWRDNQLRALEECFRD